MRHHRLTDERDGTVFILIQGTVYTEILSGIKIADSGKILLRFSGEGIQDRSVLTFVCPIGRIVHIGQGYRNWQRFWGFSWFRSGRLFCFHRRESNSFRIGRPGCVGIRYGCLTGAGKQQKRHGKQRNNKTKGSMFDHCSLLFIEISMFL